VLIQMGYGERKGQGPRILDLDQPLGTITAGGNKFGLAQATLQYNGEIVSSMEIEDHAEEVGDFLMQYNGTSIGQTPDQSVNTITVEDARGLVIVIQGISYRIVDIGFRMLEPHELFAAQGFPSNYIINIDAEGKTISKASQVARCGNSVPPDLPNALVRENLPHLCTGAGMRLTFERYAKVSAVGQLAFSI
ncbi:DNA cytosine methyltransferase, partial [Brevibacillus reuszeri]|uniref:DNA cytosine methyltransferase n=1 Tax=Brevibacillus reuszeri TaxID=54915 RepID=UPI00191394CB